ncbi:MFS transporter [Sediminibacterium roseum]|uniref:MFS transporter n=1 Tax=Sediminibacterium roseum TaxID=1978412 RepID=A0ABX0A0Z2_9BACT|nr:MFS transporter [Sediminibacterium roseum]NCI51612.1 MFS transporter [Sediminibacterium roseum]
MTTAEKIGKYRWRICGLLFFATTINYIDRSVISFLKTTFTTTYGWTDGDYADVEITFKIFYAIGLLGAGGVIDKLGTKIGYAVATGLWSIAGVATGFVNTVVGFKIVRGALGLAEAGNFPAANKTVSEWFPKKERAFAFGILNSGANVGAIVTPVVVPFMLHRWGWQSAFIVTGLLGFIWLIFWFMLYEIPRKHKKLGAAELAYIESDKDETPIADDTSPKLSWGKLLTYRQTWAFSIGKFLTDPIWWFYIFWLPDFFGSKYHISTADAAPFVAVVFVISTFGSVFGGWLPMYYINKKGWTVPKARRTAMLIYAFCVTPILFALVLGSIDKWLAVLVIGIAASAHQAWSANIFTTVSDMFPKKSTASVTGIGGMFGSIGGIFLTWLVQKNIFLHYRAINQIETAYYIMFGVCAGSYLVAWLIMKALVGKGNKVIV